MILKRPEISTPEQMQDKAMVKELLEFERFCRDNALWVEMKKCFAEDSTVNISWYQGSGHGFVDASSNMKTRAPHKIYNTQIWLNGDKAVAIMMATIQMQVEIDGITAELGSDAKLIFRLQKTDGLWMIKAFDSIYEQDRIIPVYPNNQLDLSPESFKDFRSSYACLSYMMKQINQPVHNELPGIDRPDLVEKLYQEVDHWLMK